MHYTGFICNHDMWESVFTVDTNQMLQLYIQVGFLFDLPESGHLNFFAPFHIPAKEAPRSSGRVNVAPTKQQFAFVLHHDDCHQLGFKKVNETAFRTGRAKFTINVLFNQGRGTYWAIAQCKSQGNILPQSGKRAPAFTPDSYPHLTK